MRDLTVVASIGFDTFKSYRSVYDKFLWFTSVFDLEVSNPLAIEYFLAYNCSISKSGIAKYMKPALMFWNTLDNNFIAVNDISFARLKKGSIRIWNLIDRKRLVRDPISLNYIEKYFKSSRSVDPYIFKLTCAILTLGFRLFARPGELARLRWSHIKLLANGNIKLDVGDHKTDFFMLDKPITIDRVKTVNNEICPVKSLKKYMNSVSDLKEPDSPLFSYIDDAFLSSNDITRLLKDAFNVINVTNVTVSGHSLRIGAVTEGFQKGIASSDLMLAARHKDPKSLMHYARAEALAGKSFSNTLFK